MGTNRMVAPNHSLVYVRPITYSVFSHISASPVSHTVTSAVIMPLEVAMANALLVAVEPAETLLPTVLPEYELVSLTISPDVPSTRMSDTRTLRSNPFMVRSNAVAPGSMGTIKAWFFR